MKPITMIRSLVLLTMMAAVVVGCQKEELPIGGDAPQGTPLTIRVVDSGYTASDKSPYTETRAIENGFATKFTPGDKIGIYVVANGIILLDNHGLTAGDDASWDWIVFAGTSAKYFAYYPYQSSLTGTLDPTATDAAGFFADVVSQWTPSTDQSSHAQYTAQDLMVGDGTISKEANEYTLSISLAHTMALVVIETPTTKYTLTNKYGHSLPDYETSVSGLTYNFKPYVTSLNTCRLLVKQHQKKASDLAGCYITDDGGIKEYVIEQNHIEAANYVYYKIDGGSATVINRTHTLQIGDFYLNGGTLVGKDETLTPEQRAACIGIVYYVGRYDTDYCVYYTKDDTTLISDIHGHVLALHDASGGYPCSWGYDQQTINTYSEHLMFDGYINTRAIRAFAAIKDMTLMDDFPATYLATQGHDILHTAPYSSSGWYLPSPFQYQSVFVFLEEIETSIKKALNSDKMEWMPMYWCSTEFSSLIDFEITPDPLKAYGYHMGDLRAIGVYKARPLSVRSMLTF